MDLLYLIDMAFRGIHDAYPSNTSILVLQDRHISHLVDTKQVRFFINYQLLLTVVTYNLYITNFKFGCFVAYSFGNTPPSTAVRAFMTMWRMDIRIRPYVIRAGFYGIYRLGHLTIDWPLITSLVERCSPRHTRFMCQ